ncbi:hypothetical protein XbrCFBP1976_07020 [Xanthomonas bromi]|uniref:Uncharacterized protein n=1 Tax=Xanthomonas bromi TaxID=56449 RepID=A0ABX5BRC4_9XANT|nr:hypothetical protein XbrCFBP1976_07020 [Xanthomonas bromi]
MRQRQQRQQQHRSERCTPVRRPPLAVLEPHESCSLPTHRSVGPRPSRGISRLPLAAPIVGRIKTTSGCSRAFL